MEGVKTFSFIAGEGASQLARLSSTGHYSSFNRSVSDSQHKSLHSKMALGVAVCVCVWRESVCMWKPSVKPSAIQPRIQMNSRKLQQRQQASDWHVAHKKKKTRARVCALLVYAHVCAGLMCSQPGRC